MHIMKILPKFLLKTPGMRRREKLIHVLMERVQGGHTPAQRADQPRDLVDDYLSLHASDPQFLPESNLRFAFSAALIASVYLGDMMAFCLYALATHPELHAEIRREADALFENGDPTGDDISPAAIDITRRFLMECMRLYPIVPMSVRNVMNSCQVEGLSCQWVRGCTLPRQPPITWTMFSRMRRNSTSTGICRPGMSIIAQATPRSVSAHTSASVIAGWSCNWRSTC